MAETKRRPGDRRDAALIRSTDPLHFIMGNIYPSRPDNEAYISERVDLAPIKAYLEKKNENADFKYTFFHVIIAALVRTFSLRPKLNRFYANGNYYQRHDITAAFVVKKEFSDGALEGLAFFKTRPTDTIDSIHDYIRDYVRGFREKSIQNTSDDSMEILNKLPRWLSKAVIRFMCFLDKRGLLPESIIGGDPNYSSIFLSNLGSIHLKSGYHHLTTWGTNSFFCIIGEKKWTPLYDEHGFVEMRETLDLGLTVDERIADGYYYAKSIRLFKYLLAHPELLEQSMNTEVPYE